MRAISYTTRFRRDYRREKSGRHGKRLDALLMEAVQMLAADTALPRRYFDHALSGEWKDCRDCHIRPDLVLIYRKPDDHNLELVRLGSHSELGLGSQRQRKRSALSWCTSLGKKPRSCPHSALQVGSTTAQCAYAYCALRKSARNPALDAAWALM